MKHRTLYPILTLASVALFIGAQSLDVDARGMAGGGGFSRSGPARGGSFAARSAPRAAASRSSGRQAGRYERVGSRRDALTDRRDDRRDYRDDVRDDRRDYRNDLRDDRRDYYDDRYDRWDDWGRGAAVVAGAAIVGSAISAAAYDDLDCTTVVVDGVSYSRCGSTWYRPAYSGGDVTYVVVEPPSGY
jgi:hypothetical protein